MTTNNLTKQWKKGELKPNTYYCKIKDNDYIFRLNCEQGMFFDYFWERMEYDDIEKVLAEVPSYEEWQELIDKKNWCNARAKNLLDKNQKLKELLKECREYIGNNFVSPKIRITLTKIDEVLK